MSKTAPLPSSKRAAARSSKPAGQSPAMQDYLEQIHYLIRDKGYARVVDIAARLEIAQASVTNMLQRLAAEGYVVYERYRGVTLTEEGLKVGSAIAQRHDVLTHLLSIFGLDADLMHRDVEGMKHHISRPTLAVFTTILSELETNPTLMTKLKKALL